MEPNANMEVYIDALENVDLDALDVIARQMADTLDGCGRIFVAGNGGSHAIAQHFASDLMKPVGKRDLCCHVRCLSNNVALITALANDISYDEIFSKQLEAARVGSDDLLLAFSVSGTSHNIQSLYKVAYSRHVWSFLITGRGCGTQVAPWAHGRVDVSTGLEPFTPLHYYVCESVFSVIAHEIARLFHIKRGNYRA